MTEILHDWHDFYVLLGTAAATLIGLMFVAASIGAGLFTDEHKDMMRTFLTPTIIHFCAVLFFSLSIHHSIPDLEHAGRPLGLGQFAWCCILLRRLDADKEALWFCH
jgi:hypothetical protein